MKAGRARRIGGPASVALGVVLLAAVIASPVEARKFVGTKEADRMSGTAKADVLKGRAGNDRIKGKGGNDRMAGSAGNDRIAAGKGSDTLSGGGGTDVLNAKDGAADRSVDGGPGRDFCRIDQADAPVVKGCEEVSAGALPNPDPGAGDPGGGDPGGGDPGGGDPGGGGGSEPLVVSSATGTTCGSSLPLCVFEIAGSGADQPIGLVTGGGGVTVGAGTAVSLQAPGWTASGTYGCTADGYLRVTIGSESVDVPVDCTV